jgi:hypothetical protein
MQRRWSQRVRPVLSCGLLLACAADTEHPGEHPGPRAADASATDGDASEGGAAVDAGALPPDAGRDDAGAVSVRDDSCGAIVRTSEVERAPADIVLALDTSLSMANEICRVSENLTAFADGIGVASHVVTLYAMGLLGTAAELACGEDDPLAVTPLAADPARYHQELVSVGSGNALGRLIERYEAYAPFMRPEAVTHFVVVSDDDSDSTADAFEAQMEAKLGHGFYFHAIVADGFEGCDGANVGQTYLTLAERTAGQALSICASDWASLFARLQTAVVATSPFPCDFDVPAPPDGQEVDPGLVSVVLDQAGATPEALFRVDRAETCDRALAWYFDAEVSPTRITLCPAACEAARRSVGLDIALGCAPPILE